MSSPLAGRCVHCGRPAKRHSSYSSRPCVPIPVSSSSAAASAGCSARRRCGAKPVDVMLVDRQNYHLFTPLLYQVASCLLNPSEITAPLRKVLRGAPNVRYRQGDVDRRRLRAQGRASRRRDDPRVRQLVLATGSETNYYGNEAVADRALGLKDLGEALQLRNHVLECLETRRDATDADERRRLLTFCIVGGGPTGVEYAGALAELVRLVLPHEYPGVPAVRRADRVARGWRPFAADVHAASVEVRAARARTARRRRAHRHARRVGRRQGSGAARRHRARRPRRSCGPRACDASERPVSRARSRSASRSTTTCASSAPRRVRDRRRGRRARQARRRAADALAARDAGRPLRRRADPRGPTPQGFRYRDKGTLATIGRRAAVGQIGPVRSPASSAGSSGSSCTSTT